jgi:hypothetical protein
VTVNIPICGPAYCKPPPGSRPPYDSVAGIR